MADRTACAIFAAIFDALAEKNTPECKEIAEYMWSLHFSYDFSDCQMESEDALIILGLAKKLKNGKVQYRKS